MAARASAPARAAFGRIESRRANPTYDASRQGRRSISTSRTAYAAPPLSQPAAHTQHSLKRAPPIEAFEITPVRSVPDSIPKPPSIKQKSQPMQVRIAPMSYEDVKNIARASEIVRDILNYLPNIIKPGVTTDEIDEYVHNTLIEQGAYPACLGYMGFPKSCCTSVNEVICHGIPDLRPLEDGDIVNVDIVNFYNGQHGDASKTYRVGENVDESSRKLIEVTEQALNDSIKSIGPGANLTEVVRTSYHSALLTLRNNY